ncbi:hypothetical protein F4V91_25755 [Neorhizobium galegae]|uniref:Uncharacterized protein n=1 Tax=Neorhizobium galegae TaxID=399 RepID=A0A6A1TJI0_NEOGA|nr:hypothetical protein [Neorhizobium galegae]KAB1083046.1 hypothetical protein F4V91_25755 [Neorhizobium galegae]
MTQLSNSSRIIFSSAIIANHQEAVVRLMSDRERLTTLQRMCARHALLADEARSQLKHGLEGTLLRTAAEVLTSSKEISAAACAPAFIQRLEQAIERVELGLDATGSSLGQAASH